MDVEKSQTITVEEVNRFSSSLSNNAAICYESAKSSSLPLNSSPAPTALILRGGFEENSSVVSAINDIPIPIFTSSQYSIQRRRTRSTPRPSINEERRPPTTSQTELQGRQNMSTVRVLSTDCGMIFVFGFKI